MPPTPWWQRDKYMLDTPLPVPFVSRCGPRGIGTVAVMANGKTQLGWGLLGRKNDDGTREPGFTHRYPRGEFIARKTEWQYLNNHKPFAFIMRSLRIIAIDIDGKNDGFVGALTLGQLPETLAETSKSGTGYHLFYSTDEQWDDELGFALFDDHIGIAQGVDIRATGCIFHYPTQRWNNRDIVPLPDELRRLLTQKKERRIVAQATTANIEEMDMDDKLVAQHTLLTDLAQPVLPGRRNNTLFAIGSKMKAAGVEKWDEKVHDRALELGLDWDEADKLVGNIAAYGE